MIRVPWNYDYTDMDFDGLFLANGPGDPDMCEDAVNIIRKQISQSRKLSAVSVWVTSCFLRQPVLLSTS